MDYFSDSRLAGKQAPIMRDIPDAEAGLTLIEMMIVITIIAIVAGMIVFSGILNRPDEARVTVTKSSLSTVAGALKMYRLDNGTYPSDEQELKALTERPTTEPVPQAWTAGGYLSAPATDAWGRPFTYSLTPEGFVLKSLGRDGKQGGEGIDADIELKG